MLTIGDIGIRKFEDKDGIISSTRADCPIAVNIPMKDFQDSAAYFTSSKSKVLAMNGHEVLEDIMERVSKYAPARGENSWGNVTVYRDHVDSHGYIERTKAGSKLPVLTPDVPISKIAFGRLITSINLIGNDDYNTAIAVKWEPGKCQVAIGFNVRICQNYNIFGGTMLESGINLTYESMAKLIDTHIQQIEQKFQTDLATVARLAAMQINDSSMKYLLGDMLHSYNTENHIIGLTDIHYVSKKLHERDVNAPITMWDFTNAVTNVLKFDASGGDSVLTNIQRANQYLVGKLR